MGRGSNAHSEPERKFDVGEEERQVGKLPNGLKNIIEEDCPPHARWQSLSAIPRDCVHDCLSVALVAGILVPCFTVFPSLALFCLWYVYSTWGWVAFVPVVTLLAVTITLPPYYSPVFKKNIFRLPLLELLNYVRPFKIYKNCTLPSDKTYVMCWHPHGRLFYGFAVFCGLFDVWFPELNGREYFGGINDAMFTIPLLSNLLYLTGVVPCNRKAIDRRLKASQHIGLIIGGIEEVLEGTFDDKDVLWLKKRKGFAKIAMDHGSGLVPVYAFGENQLFQHEPRWVLKFWKFVNRFVKVGAPLPIRGIWNLPIPYRRELVIAVGEPLFARDGETVDEFHGRYVAAVEALFAQYVGRTSRPNQKLVVV